MFIIQPQSLTTAELVHYAQMALDRKEALPILWQEELVKRLFDALDDNK